MIYPTHRGDLTLASSGVAADGSRTPLFQILIRHKGNSFFQTATFWQNDPIPLDDAEQRMTEWINRLSSLKKQGL